MHATATTPLANMGYYAFPVDTVKFVLESESLYEPERVRELGPVKLAEMFHADSVLFIKVTYWDAPVHRVEHEDEGHRRVRALQG